MALVRLWEAANNICRGSILKIFALSMSSLLKTRASMELIMRFPQHTTNSELTKKIAEVLKNLYLCLTFQPFFKNPVW